MAMMMTGRVLLVCALCVLWCGTSGGRCDEDVRVTEEKKESSGDLQPVTPVAAAGKQHAEPINQDSDLVRQPLVKDLEGPSPKHQTDDKVLGVVDNEDDVTDKEKEERDKAQEGAPDGQTQEEEEVPPPPSLLSPAPLQSPPPPAASDGTQPGGGPGADSSGGGSNGSGSSIGGGGSNLETLAHNGGNQSAFGSLGYGGETGSFSGGAGKGGVDIGSPRGDFSDSSLSADGTFLSPAPDAPSSQGTQSSANVERSKTMPAGLPLPNVNAPKGPESKAGSLPPNTQEKAKCSDANGGAAGNKAKQSDVETEDPSSSFANTGDQTVEKTLLLPQTPAVLLPVPSAELSPEVPPVTPVQANPDGEGGLPTAPRASEASKREMQNKASSPNKTGSESPDRPSKDGMQEQKDKVTTQLNTTKKASAGGLAETTAKSISANENGDVQNKEDEDDARQPKPNRPQDDAEAGNTNVAPTVSEAAIQTAETVTTSRKNDTAPPEDSDGSTAAFHTTSPLLLLLLVFACAAAAAVEAA
ncbi:Mucin-associated surface protein (MASP) [Trypanosoma cruzi]|uniref:Mucin-associated surface protein (MASP), putative n=3 Tax=Trypanosoma cruzi TaxID=5693 RepID=Q4DHM5_TRYCC|nr:mucin-associated surface protein (MASP), putative [Trypanosoma cruzi]EAN92031.1 mucin-associated surface protein (MASP), putative [Trypanosoma cruzi]PWV13032.1 Mucin-associated surface protein (MASP) [Trypanosoma cruzi]|eukprot:XP_813882.1 mucin-associated surface protein (MASP) [Trypanosoma cruzi strain CL Brener]